MLLLCASAVFAGFLGLLLADGQRPGATFFDNLVLAVPALLVLGSAGLAFLSALVAVWRLGERSAFVYGALSLGGSGAILTIAELVLAHG